MIGAEVVSADYDWNKDELVIKFNNGVSLVVDVAPKPGADGGLYQTLRITTKHPAGKS